jgi:hypothetical protein
MLSHSQVLHEADVAIAVPLEPARERWTNEVHVGIANQNALSVKPVFEDENMGVEVRMRTKAGKTVKFVNKSKSSRRVIASTGKQVASYRPDLKAAVMSAAGVASAAVYRARTESAEEWVAAGLVDLLAGTRT